MHKLLVALAFLSICFSSRAQLSEVELPVKKIKAPAFRDSSIEKWNRSFPAYASLNNHEKEVLYWVNLARKRPDFFLDSVVRPILRLFPELQGPEVRSLAKDMSSAGSLPLFEPHRTLIQLAREHAYDLASKKAPLSHNSTNGTSFATRTDRAGVKTCAGENLGLGSQGMLLSVVLLYLDKGLNPPGHRQSLLSRQYTQIGVGVKEYGADQLLLVQEFSCPLPFR